MADVLTDIPGKPGRFWGDHTTLVGPVKPPPWLLKRAGNRWAHNLTGCIAGLRLFACRGRCHGVVTDGGSSGMLFAWLQALCPWGRKPHVMIDCLWGRSPHPLTHWLKKLRVHLAARSVDRFVVWSSHEVEDFAQAFDLPREKLQFVPFHTTLHDYDYEVRDDGYIFAGGNSDRDYRTLVEAVRPLTAPTWIATTRPDLLSGVEVPDCVRVEGTTVDGFRRAMAAARLVVVPMQKGTLRSGGQQTLLNAMLMGKPTIAVGRRWAGDYIDDGVNGLIVDYEDPEGMREAVRRLLDDPDGARRMGEQACARAADFTTQRCMETVYNLVKHAGAEAARGRTAAPSLASGDLI
jgi:glycosyltransferase involved in cell wall biosynthesis